MKVVQEAIALVVVSGFVVLVLKEPLERGPLECRHPGAFVCLGAVAFLFAGR